MCELVICKINIVLLCTVPIGGLLLEYYLIGFAADHVHRQFISMRKETTRQGDESISPANNVILLNAVLPQFCGWLLTNMNVLSRKAKRQLFYLAFVLKFYGLSQAGLQLLSRIGQIPSVSYLSNVEQACIAHSTQQQRYHYIHMCMSVY